MYRPEPIDTTRIDLSAELQALLEELARNTHDVWAQQRLADGWSYGAARHDARREHPGLVPYEDLSEEEKDYDRNTAREVLKVILASGFSISKST